MKKIHIFFIILFIYSFQGFSQRNINSSLESESYYNYPRQYLSQLDTSKMQTNILIDRIITDINLLAYDGITVTTCDLRVWNTMYRSIKFAAIDTSVFLNGRFIERLARSYNQSQKVNLIALIDVTFDKISQEALFNGDFREVDTLLTDYYTSDTSYTQHRMISSCVLGSSNIWGDDIKFVLPEFLQLSNIANEEIIALEIDLGDGLGFRNISFNDTVEGNYSSVSQWEEVILKVSKRDKNTLEEFDLYTHFTFQRTGKGTVPEPDVTLLYPLGSYYEYDVIDEEYYECLSFCGGSNYDECVRDCADRHIVHFPGTVNLDVKILFADGNNSGKLRRPFMIVDGFDPGDSRTYYKTYVDPKSIKGLPLNNDGRGLYQLLNGDPSPWYDPNGPNFSVNYQNVNLISRLKILGFDIIFVNFIKGADYIGNNANSLRSLLNEVINSDMYRDSQTEELVLVGPSMGGLITRYALSSMEEAGEEHYVKTWISFDAPQKGAYISIALQYALDFFQHIKTGPIPMLIDAKASFVKNLTKLNTPAAKQMLLQHYSNSGMFYNYSAEFVDFYNTIDYLNIDGFPNYCENLAISNGGSSKLYGVEHAQVIAFFPDWLWWWFNGRGWSNMNGSGSGSINLFEGSRFGLANDVYKYGVPNIAYDNAPGGWYPALYSLNSQEKNTQIKDPYIESDKQYVKTCFMVTSSSFGIEVTKDNVFNTHEDYTANDTPFDVIFGMENNEQHVTISNITADFMDEALGEDIANTIRPRNREDEDLNQTLCGRLAYNVNDNIIFAGNTNTFVVKNTADININSGNSIQFLPGFKVEEGAKVSAKIISSKKTVDKMNNTHQQINYLKPSPYLGKITNYGINNIVEENEKACLLIYPNPSDGIFSINLKNNNIESDSYIKVYSNLGLLLFNEKINGENIFTLNLSSYANGLYQIEIIQGEISTFSKIVKI